MRCSGLAQSHGAVPPISQRPLRRSTTFRGQQPCQCSGRPDRRLALGLPRPGGPGITLRRRLRVSPMSSDSKYFPCQRLRAFFRHMTRGFPQGQGAQVFPSPRWLRAFFSPHSSGFPLRQLAQSFPFAGGSGVSPFAGWRRALPWPEASKLPNADGPGFPPRRVAQSFLFAGGAGLLLARRPGFALCRVARGFPLTGGSGFPPSPVTVPVVGEFLRLSAGPHKGFRAAISRFFSRPQAIHS